MYFGRRISAFCAAVVVFTLETHDSSLGGPIAHHTAQTHCEGCRPERAENGPRVANTRLRPPPLAGWQNSYHGAPETPPANGWYQIAAGGSEFLSGPGFSGGSGGGGSGNGGNSGNQPGNDTGSGGGSGSPGGDSGSGGGTHGGSGDNGNPDDHQGGDTGNGGGGGGPPVVIIDPPPGGPVSPPDGPVTPPVDPGRNTPGTTDVPEPASLAIALAGLAGLAAVRRRKRSH